MVKVYSKLMKANQQMRLFAGMIVLIAFAFGIGTEFSFSQEKTNQKPAPQATPDFSRYAVAELNPAAITDEAERLGREAKSKRYDKYPMIIPSPGPKDSLVVIYDAEPEPEALPTRASKLIVVGTIHSSSAFVSSNGKGIYSEYGLEIESVLVNRTTQALAQGGTISIDRAGGILKYPSGQTILYLTNWQDLPRDSKRYIFFLDKDNADESPNFRIITGYRFENDRVLPLDRGERFAEMSQLTPSKLTSLVMGRGN